MTNEVPSIQAIIVTWNKKKDVLALLRQLRQVRYPRERLSILVVDNASDDGTAQAVLADHPDVALLRHTENRGGAGGFNAGMRWALAHRPPADYLWLLDNDVQVDPEALSALVRVMEHHPQAAICGSRIMDADDRNRLIEVGAFLDYRCGDIQRHEPDAGTLSDGDAVYPVDYVAACSLLARTSAVEAVGLWRERFFIYWDDMEWGARLNAAGYEVLAANASIVYHPSWFNRTADPSAVWRTYYRTRNSLWFFNNYSHGMARRRLLCRMVARYGLFALNNAINANNPISQAFLNGVRSFFNNDFGKKRFDLAPLSLFDAIAALKVRQMMFFVSDRSISAAALRLADDIARRFPGIGIHCVLPAMLARDWEKRHARQHCLYYSRTTTGGISVTDKYRILKFMRSNRWQLLIASAHSPKLGTIWGRPTARVDFQTGAILSIDRMAWQSVGRMMFQLPFMAARGLLFLPKPAPRPKTL